MSRKAHDIAVIGIVLFAFLSQFILAPWLVESRVSEIRNLAVTQHNQDAMLICTGTSMRWASQQVFMETGKLEFIEPPVEVTSNTAEVECSNSFLVKLSSDLMPYSALHLPNWQKYLATVQTLAQRPYTAFPYQTSLSRAPPLV